MYVHVTVDTGFKLLVYIIYCNYYYIIVVTVGFMIFVDCLSYLQRTEV